VPQEREGDQDSKSSRKAKEQKGLMMDLKLKPEPINRVNFIGMPEEDQEEIHINSETLGGNV
jgi:hypothetical protein